MRAIAPGLCLALCALSAAPAAAQTAPAAAQTEPARESVNTRLIAYYGLRSNYRRVRRDVLTWHGTTRNGCVAFVSSALRHIGFDVPERGKRDGYGVSRITFAFSDHLEAAGWVRITDVSQILPGDVVFTTGYPDHVFVFHSWSQRRKLLARVIDNRGFLTTRAMFPPRSSSDAAFSYALRAEL